MPALLTPYEVAALRKCSGKESQVLQMWALESVWQGYQKVGAERSFKSASDAILDCRKCTATLPNTLDMPIPFPYYHALCALMFINYALYTVTFLEMDSWITPVAVFLIVAVTTGVRELSSSLANPFGDDEVDFNSSRFMHKLRGLVTFMSHGVNHETWSNPSAVVALMPPQQYYQDPQTLPPPHRGAPDLPQPPPQPPPQPQLPPVPVYDEYQQPPPVPPQPQPCQTSAPLLSRRQQSKPRRSNGYVRRYSMVAASRMPPYSSHYSRRRLMTRVVGTTMGRWSRRLLPTVMNTARMATHHSLLLHRQRR